MGACSSSKYEVISVIELYDLIENAKKRAINREQVNQFLKLYPEKANFSFSNRKYPCGIVIFNGYYVLKKAPISEYMNTVEEYIKRGKKYPKSAKLWINKNYMLF
jgi:hypothetical protein